MKAEDEKAEKRELEMYCVYARPLDYPGKFVARRMVIRPGTVEMAEVVVVKDTLGEVRASLPRGMYRIPRDSSDDPVIVETWMR